MGGRNDVKQWSHYENEAKITKRVGINGLNYRDTKLLFSLLKKANEQQLQKLSEEVLKERLNRCLK